jgi:hypothetical protein
VAPARGLPALTGAGPPDPGTYTPLIVGNEYLRLPGNVDRAAGILLVVITAFVLVGLHLRTFVDAIRDHPAATPPVPVRPFPAPRTDSIRPWGSTRARTWVTSSAIRPRSA